MISNPRARFALAHRLQRGEEVPLGEIFSFLSGLYFRGKFCYARQFGRPPARLSGSYVITSNSGLVPAEKPISLTVLESFATTDIDPRAPAYAEPLQRDARRIARKLTQSAQVVLLGSIGTKKYAEPLVGAFADRLYFPASFVGRGDMSRGGLLLRCVAENRELDYVPVLGAARHGKRPEKLPPRSWGYKTMEGSTPLPIDSTKNS